jgi:hypothetical protein
LALFAPPILKMRGFGEDEKGRGVGKDKLEKKVKIEEQK